MAGSNVDPVHLVLFCLVVGSRFQPASCGVFGLIRSVKCYFSVCCDDTGIIKNFAGLERDLNSKLHGQHLVRKTVLGHVKAHFKLHNPSKALVLSFHGPTGVGKNHVARIIAENIYKDGMHSKFVHLIAATKEFLHESKVEQYKDKLKDWIESSVKKCERSMFIFDEVDKLPSQLLDVIKPYLDHYDHLGGIDYRKAVFVFLSNSGSSKILNIFMDHWRVGKRRDELQLRNFESDVMLSAINDQRNGGLWHSHLISNNLITAFVPFLPLEKYHVRQCIQDDLIAKKLFNVGDEIPPEVIESVIEELKFIPDAEQLLSATGCKRVSEKVDFAMLDLDPHKTFNRNQEPRKRARDEI